MKKNYPPKKRRRSAKRRYVYVRSHVFASETDLSHFVPPMYTGNHNLFSTKGPGAPKIVKTHDDFIASFGEIRDLVTGELLHSSYTEIINGEEVKCERTTETPSAT